MRRVESRAKQGCPRNGAVGIEVDAGEAYHFVLLHGNGSRAERLHRLAHDHAEAAVVVLSHDPDSPRRSVGAVLSLPFKRLVLLVCEHLARLGGVPRHLARFERAIAARNHQTRRQPGSLVSQWSLPPPFEKNSSDVRQMSYANGCDLAGQPGGRFSKHGSRRLILSSTSTRTRKRSPPRRSRSTRR